MPLSKVEVLKRNDLMNDRRRLRSRIVRNERMIEEHKAMICEMEMELAAVEVAIQALERRRAA